MDAIEKPKPKQTTRETTARVEASANKTAEGLRDCQTMIFAATQANINAMFDYMQEAFSAKSMPELMELSSKHARQQMETMTEQAREIASAVQKVTVDSTRSFSGLADAFNRTT